MPSGGSNGRHSGLYTAGESCQSKQTRPSRTCKQCRSAHGYGCGTSSYLGSVPACNWVLVVIFFSFLWNGIGILNFRQYQRWLSKKACPEQIPGFSICYHPARKSCPRNQQVHRRAVSRICNAEPPAGEVGRQGFLQAGHAAVPDLAIKKRRRRKKQQHLLASI